MLVLVLALVLVLVLVLVFVLVLALVFVLVVVAVEVVAKVFCSQYSPVVQSPVWSATASLVKLKKQTKQNNIPIFFIHYNQPKAVNMSQRT